MADFTLKPDFPVDTKTQWKTLVSSAETPYKQRRRKWQNKLRIYPLTFSSLTATEATTLQTLFDSKHGAADSFTFDDPVTAEVVTCVFQEDSLSIKQTTPNTYTASVVLEEVK